MRTYGMFSQELAHRMLGHLKRNEIALELRHFRRSDTVLEIGCAEGFLLRHLIRRRYARRAIGCDVSAFKTKQAARRARSEGLHGELAFVCGDGSNLPFPDEAFDVVVLPHVLEHISTKERVAALLREALRVSRFGMLVAVPVRDSSHPLLKWSKYLGYEHIVGLWKYKNGWVYDSRRLLEFLEENGTAATRSAEHDRAFRIVKLPVAGA